MSRRKHWNGSVSDDLLTLFSEDLAPVFFHRELCEQVNGRTTFRGALYVATTSAACKSLRSFAKSMKYDYDEEQIRISDFKLSLRVINVDTAVRLPDGVDGALHPGYYEAPVMLGCFRIHGLLNFLAKPPVKAHGVTGSYSFPRVAAISADPLRCEYHVHARRTRPDKSASWDVSLLITPTNYPVTSNNAVGTVYEVQHLRREYKRLV